MTALYPYSLDTFRAWLTEHDYMIARDLADAFDAIIAVQTELGIKPSAELGTIHARLYGNGNISTVTGLWTKVQVGRDGGLSTLPFQRLSIEGFARNYDPQRFKGQETVFGEDIPAVFGQMQDPLTSPSGANQRGGAPWRSTLALVQDNRFSWTAIDGENSDITGSNFVLNAMWGFLAWNMIT